MNAVSTNEEIIQSLNWDYIAEDPEFKDVLRREFEELLVTSDLLVLKRLTNIEQVLELNGWKDLYDDEIKVLTFMSTDLLR
jgi:hypothetical protein